MPLPHGGDIAAAAKTFGIAKEQWLDLSTGLNPRHYPIAAFPARSWQKLPNDNAALVDAAARYYGCAPNCILPIPGSQSAIQALPRIFPRSRIALPDIGYREHLQAWQENGHQITVYRQDEPERIADQIVKQRPDLLLIINPNNPGCTLIEREQLLHWHSLLQKQGGTLLVDEAFIDTRPEHSLASECGKPGLILLRSFGKYFGLAGARLGFLLATVELIERCKTALGPWPVNGPALWLGEQALSDSLWQTETSARLKQSSRQLLQYLQESFQHPCVRIDKTDLFVSLFLSPDHAGHLYQNLGSRGILVREIAISEQQACVRIGLTATPAQKERFESAIEAFIHNGGGFS